MLKLRRRRDVPHTMAVVPGDNKNNDNGMNRNVEQPASSSTSSGKAFKYIIFILAIVVLITIGYHLGLLISRLKNANTNTALEYEYDYDAVVVGAGWAGIRAAKTLIDAGISSVLVLEANDYVGGRAKSVNLDGTINSGAGNLSNIPMDIGPEWQYLGGNDLAKQLSNVGLLDNVDLENYEDDWILECGLGRCAQFYKQTLQSNGSVNTTMMDNSEVKMLHDKVWEGFMKFRRDQNAHNDEQSYASAAKKYKNDYLENDKERQYLELIMSIGELEYATDITNISFLQTSLAKSGFTDGSNRQGYMGVRGVGYGNVAASVSAPFTEKIKLGAKVTGINYEDSSNVIITYTQGGATRSVDTRTVVLTVSLGVLKKRTISFTPTLPTSKLEVIDKMGYGTLNKCIMQWNKRDAIVWPEDKQWFELLSSEKAGKWATFFNPTKFKGVPTLVGWIGGKAAWEMELKTDDEIIEDVMLNLREMFPNITNPDRVIISRWGVTDNIHGTYSHKKINRSRSSDASELRERVGNVFFAGEATAKSWYATCIGAWNSGEEAALGMIDLLKN